MGRILFMRYERGNALFLILIAVALFAALSYAVTQSGRSGGGVDKEQGIILASQLTQYGSEIHNAVTRMLLTGTDENNLDFGLGAGLPCTSGVDCVFATEGGGVTYQTPPSAIYNFEYNFFGISNNEAVSGIGTTAPDILVKLRNITLPVCEAINDGFAISSIGQDSVAGDGTLDAYPLGEPFACYLIAGGTHYSYYHVFKER